MSAAELDCLTCGACCRSGHDGRILIPPEDLVRWRATGRSDVAAAIQGDVVRVSGKKRDDLQDAMALLKKTELELPLQFDNFRD